MKRTAGGYRFSPSDLINYVRSEFITWMDRFTLDHPSEAEPDPDSAEMRILQDKGIEHEEEFLAGLKAAGRGVTDFGGQKLHLPATLAAMRRGDDIVYQGYLEDGEFGGYPDFLVRVDTPSSLGAWSYEPWDTKLARHPKPYFLIQLCCYAEMLEAAQGVRPRRLRIVLGTKTDAGPAKTDFRTDDFYFYYRALIEAFLEQQRAFDATRRPEIDPHADLGRWAGFAGRVLEERDDLALVANIRGDQRRKLVASGIGTVPRWPRPTKSTWPASTTPRWNACAGRRGSRSPRGAKRGRTLSSCRWMARTVRWDSPCCRPPRPATFTSIWKATRWWTKAASTCSAPASARTARSSSATGGRMTARLSSAPWRVSSPGRTSAGCNSRTSTSITTTTTK